MARIEIADFDIDLDVAAHIWLHGLTDRRLYAMLDNRYVVRRNRVDRTAPFVLIGTDDQGQCWTVPIVPTDDPLIWRPIAAWRCKNHEAQWLGRGR
jgi:hypothetical protein